MKNRNDFYKVDDKLVFNGIDIVIGKRRKRFDTSDVLAKSLELLIDNINLEGCYYCPCDCDNDCPCSFNSGCDICKKYIKSYFIEMALKKILEESLDDDSREVH